MFIDLGPEHEKLVREVVIMRYAHGGNTFYSLATEDGKLVGKKLTSS